MLRSLRNGFILSILSAFHVTCRRVCCEHQSRGVRIIGHAASDGHYSASMWVEEEIRWHCHGVPATQQHVAVSVRSDETRH